MSSTCTSFAASSKICRLLLKKIGHHKLLGFVDQYVFKMSMTCFFTRFNVISKLQYSFESPSLNTRQDEGLSTLPCLHHTLNHTTAGNRNTGKLSDMVGINLIMIINVPKILDLRVFELVTGVAN